MSEPDTLVGRIATTLITEMDSQMRAIASTEQEWDAWAKFCGRIDWRRVALSSMETLNANIAYAVQESERP